MQPVKSVAADYIAHDGGTEYEIGIGGFVSGMQLQLAAGEQPDAAASDYEVVIPDSYLDALSFDDADAAIGEPVTIAVTDADRTQHEIDATIVGVAEASLGTTSSAVPNDALNDALFDAQSTGLDASQLDSYSQATIWFDPASTAEEVTALQDRVEDAGYDSATVADQLGAFKSVIDGIVLVLNAFAVIALLAASFGIVNTLLMSVQERTREIGLMKAMGMGSGKVFGLFSMEAVFIGFLGSAIGAGARHHRRQCDQLGARGSPPRRPARADAHRVRPGVDRRDHRRRHGRGVPRGHAARGAGGTRRPRGVAALRVTRDA